jgi:T-complex protein 1 subunit gamma
MKEADVWDPISVKLQTFKTSIECACMLLRIDDIVSGIKKEKKGQKGGPAGGEEEETFGDQRDG